MLICIIKDGGDKRMLVINGGDKQILTMSLETRYLLYNHSFVQLSVTTGEGGKLIPRCIWGSAR